MVEQKQTLDADKERLNWINEIEGLLSDIESWAKGENWLTARQDKELREEDLGPYVTTELKISSPKGILLVEPVARFVVGAEGRVDLSAWPSLNRVRILRDGTTWKVRTDSGVDWPHPWCRETFLELADGLTAES